MPIDNILVKPIRTLVRMVGIDIPLHPATTEVTRAEDAITAILSKEALIANLESMLIKPGAYIIPKPGLHPGYNSNYQLKPEDRAFLQGFLEKARQSDWNNPNQVKELGDYVDAYCPRNPVGLD